MKLTYRTLLASIALAYASLATAQDSGKFVSLFNGKDLTHWKIPEGDNGHWKVLDGVIDYDALSEAPERKKDLWSAKEYGDFVLRIEWRIKDTPATYAMPDVLADGTYRLGADGKPILTHRPNADSGIYLRGSTKAQLNIWCWPIGSGEIYGYRNDAKMPPEVRRATTPKMRADKPVGEWNAFEITLQGDRVTVVLNGKTVIENAQLPDIPSRGPIGLQHHGSLKNGKYDGASALVQFRNISIREILPSGK